MLIALLKSETNKGREKCLCLICSKIVLLLVQNGYKTCFHLLWCNSEMHTSMCVYLSTIFEYFRNSVIILRMVWNINIVISLKYICLELRSYNLDLNEKQSPIYTSILCTYNFTKAVRRIRFQLRQNWIFVLTIHSTVRHDNILFPFEKMES